MATLCMGLAPIYQNASVHKSRLQRPQRFICKSMSKTRPDANHVDLRRRSGNYQPSSWDHSYLLSIENKYANEKERKTRQVLKQIVKKMLDAVETKSRLEQLELVDDLQKLGVSYYFELEINNILTNFHHENGKNTWKCDKEEDLHATALEFRLLRQHGFDVSEDIFDVISDKIKSNTFKSDDIKSIITLYEASYLSTKLDTKLHKIIRPFATEKIRKFVDDESETLNVEVREMAIHALEMPYHWRMRRLEMRWFIDAYQKKHDMNLSLLEFAKIDFNMVQTAHQEDVKYVSSWWKETGLGSQLQFVRDRIVENYIWTVGMIHEPQFGYVRRIVAIVAALITVIDDIYDIYGTLEELELFTALVENWDVNRLDELPEYMKLCFLTLYNEINAMGCDVLKYKNIDVIPFFQKIDLCKAYLLEAKWYKGGYKPSLEEYMQNAWISISAPTMLIHFYCAFPDEISIQVLESLVQQRQQVVRCSASVLRLANDLATSSDELARGDVLKSVQCYMHETGASEEEAREHVQQMIRHTWNEMNYEARTATRSSSLLSQDFVEVAMNLARMSQCMYQHGDGHGCPDKAKVVDRIQTLIVDPVPSD
ncbi:PREDICTED: beta-myrcene/(E)-beta-ocimene synthase 2, chloroplastic [Camelina sativa]|uniref:Beta-myrcene/(E)-beta-ocimene synthase 2, chloroplastic n=1 Tax=Camelina sativa TaxID=90675 RepID=A0ABM0ZDF2_CAMSA|nr:PREDICTED: beta-myrcene/(E)-beta-ocimene synthase 2, chloroplastic [Camelina sativa]